MHFLVLALGDDLVHDDYHEDELDHHLVLDLRVLVEQLELVMLLWT